MKAALITSLPKAYPIIHVTSSSAYTLAMSFLRMQEHYESPNPRFRNGVFTLEQYMDWYVKNQPDRPNRKNDRGHFTYPQDWTGFNVPDHVVRFFGDFFPNKSEKEKKLLELIWREVDRYARSVKDFSVNVPFYVIGTCTRDPDAKETIEHEIRHGLFHCDADYREAVTKIVRRHRPRCRKLFESLRAAGYAGQVEIDEAQAYALTGWRQTWTPTPSMERLAAELKRVERRFVQ